MGKSKKAGVERKPVLLVQEITTRWTKVSRVGPLARVRYTVPEQMPFPVDSVSGSKAQVIFHSVYFDEENSFSAPLEKITASPYVFPGTGCITAGHNGQHAWVTFVQSSGAPIRLHMRKTLWSLPGEWVQMMTNGRYAPGWHGHWWYIKTVVNAGLFFDLDKDVFTRYQPASQFNAMGHLW
ncbi:MAG TPA: hypothetical protein PLL06_09970 [Acidobacteriota bacterium]|nr:hypothetical protein [Acidobacteriota bacterium]